MPENLPYLDKGLEWLLIHGIDFILNVVVFFLILVVGGFLIRNLCRVFESALQRSMKSSKILQGFMVNICHKILWVIVIMIGLQQLGIDVAPLIAGLGVTGFIVGFAFQESLGNLASGLMIALNQPFKVGDFVECGGTSGVVRELNMMAVTLITPDNKKVVIPNRGVWGSAITNFSAMDTRRVDIVVGVAYGSDLGRAKQVIKETVAGLSDVLDEPPTVVEVVAMADSSVNFVVRPWCKTPNYWAVYFAAHRAIKEALDHAGIEIPFPQMDVHHHGLSSVNDVT